MSAYYNEIDPYAAAWLRNLIVAGHIAPGEVDERSIEDVRPDDLRGFTQCHFFAGIGVWSYALRLAGWPDDRPVWTGSCPCQPFSAAGKGHGFADERHLWPAWQHLIAQCLPPVVFGEQVASKAVEPWIDLVHADLEGMGYAFGCVPFPSAGIGAPHIRDRSFWVADARSNGLQGRVLGRSDSQWQDFDGPIGCDGATRGLAHPDGRHASTERQQRSGEQRQQSQDGGAGGLANANCIAGGQGSSLDSGRHSGSDAQPRSRLGGTELLGGMADAEIASEWGHTGVTRGKAGEGSGQARSPHGDANRGAGGMVCIGRTGPTNGFWRDADWLGCTDGKWRPVEPGTFPLAHGASSRVGRLRAYGNAINAEAAAEFIRAAY